MHNNLYVWINVQVRGSSSNLVHQSTSGFSPLVVIVTRLYLHLLYSFVTSSTLFPFFQYNFQPTSRPVNSRKLLEKKCSKIIFSEKNHEKFIFDCSFFL